MRRMISDKHQRIRELEAERDAAVEVLQHIASLERDEAFMAGTAARSFLSGRRKESPSPSPLPLHPLSSSPPHHSD